MASTHMMKTRTEKRSRTCLPLVLGSVVASMPLWLSGSELAYSAPAVGQRVPSHNKNNLPKHPLEIPFEEPEETPVPKPPMPEKRVPYSLHIETQLPHHMHIETQLPQDDSDTRTVIEDKLHAALSHFADGIRHVEVHLKVEENFHKEQPGAGKFTHVDTEGEKVAEANVGHRLLAPYIFKATVSLTNGHQVVLSNPSKHAQTSLVEAVDHMCDVLTKGLREDKEKWITQRKKDAKAPQLVDQDDSLLDEALDEAEALEAEKDAEDEAMYAKVEAEFK